MKYENILLIAIALIAFLFLMGALSKLPKVRYTFIVPEGYVGLLYHRKHGERAQKRSLALSLKDTRRCSVSQIAKVLPRGQYPP